jgi:hypothetical protein
MRQLEIFLENLALKTDAVSILKSLECSGIEHSIFEVVSK